MSVVHGRVVPNSVQMKSDLGDIITSTCIIIEPKPKNRLRDECYTITSVRQRCGYEYGYDSGMSDAHTHKYQLNYERYGICVRNFDFVTGYIEGFKQIEEPDFTDVTKEPTIIIKSIDGNAIEAGINYDILNDTYIVSRDSSLVLQDYDFIIGRNYIYEVDQLSGATLFYNYDGTFDWKLNENGEYGDTFCNISAIDLNKSVSTPAEVRVIFGEKTRTPILSVVGDRSIYNKSRIDFTVTVENFIKGFKYYPDGSPVVDKNIDTDSVYYEDFINNFEKNSGTLYYDGSYIIYSETYGILGTYPLTIEKGKFSVSMETYVRDLGALKFVFKIRAKDYLKTKSDFGYCELNIDGVPEVYDMVILGQFSKPSWYGLTNIKLSLLNYIQGHKYAVYLDIDPEEGGDIDNYERPSLYIAELKSDTFYIPFKWYQFKNKNTGQYGYHVVGDIMVFDITNDDTIDFTNVYRYRPDVDYSSIKKVSHWAGVGSESSSSNTYYLNYQAGVVIT